MISKEQLLERERRWGLIAGIASVAAVALILTSLGASAASVGRGGGLADRFAEITADETALVVASILQAIGFLLLVAPLVYLFKAVSARAPQVRHGLIGLVVIAPLFLGAAGLVNVPVVIEAAAEFEKTTSLEIQTCVGEKLDERTPEEAQEAIGPVPTDLIEECREEAAIDARTSSALTGVATGLFFAGILGFSISIVYCALWGMRTGLLTRFWGSLGLALGAVAIVFITFTLVWFIYIGLLFAGWVPGGRPPAWASGDAMPWPKGRPRGGDDGKGDDGSGDAPDPDGPGGGAVLEGFGEEVPDGTAPDPTEAPEPDDAPQIERRKRKKRNG